MNRAGFTLIELMVVLAIMLGVLAVAFPRLLPVIAFSGHEGAARRLSSYGRNAMSQASLLHEHYTVYVDLDAQEYYVLRWPKSSEFLEGFEEDGAEDKADEDSEEPEPMKRSEDLLAAMATMEEDGSSADFDLEYQSAAMQFRFDEFHRQRIMVQTKNVEYDDGLLAGVADDLFSEDFTFDEDAAPDEPTEISDPLLPRTKLPRDIYIEAVRVGDKEIARGVVEIEITSVGLAEPVTFFVKNKQNEYYTVTWDAVTGDAYLQYGLPEGG